MGISFYRAANVVVFALLSAVWALSASVAPASDKRASDALTPEKPAIAKPTDAAEIREFLRVTGFDVALASITMSARDGPAMLGMSDEDFVRPWTLVADDIFARDRLHDMAIEMLTPTMTHDVRTEAMVFYGSDLGQRLVAAENVVHMLEDNSEQDAVGAQLLADASARRLALLTRMADGVDGSDVAVHAVQDIQIRFLMAASHAGLFDRELDEAQLRAQMAQTRDALRDSIRSSGRVAAAYTYRDFTDAELTTYVEALETPTMQRVYELLNAVQFEIIANRFEKLAYSLANLRQGQAL